MRKLVFVLLLILLLVPLASVACVDSEDSLSSDTTSNSPTDTSTSPPMTVPTTSPPTSEPTTAPASTETTVPPTTTSDIPAQPILTVGQKGYYALLGDGVEFGHSKYEVVSEEVREGVTVYTIQGDVEMETSCPVTPTTGTATLQIDQSGGLVSYVSSASIGVG